MEAPVFVGALELTEPIVRIELPERADGVPYNAAYMLVKLGRVPVGQVLVQAADTGPETLARQIWTELGAAISARYTAAGLPAVTELTVAGLPAMPEPFDDDTADRPLISVVVCTRDRAESLLATLRSLAAMHYRPFEVVVVDNAPSTEATKEAVLAHYGEDPRFRYVRELRPGLSCARNRGLAEAAADFVAFTDDDVIVDSWWLNGILRGFRAAPDVSCVTGQITTAVLENSMQVYFHLREGWGASCDRQVFDLDENADHSPLYPYSPGVFGTGANFAVTRGLMKEIGEFDEALGAGSMTGGGEDLEIFMRIVLNGHRIVYEPAAIAMHYHRDDFAALVDQMHRYGSGCTAAMISIAMRVPRARRELPPRLLQGFLRIFELNERVNDNPSLPKGLKLTEFRGLVRGPELYFRSRRKLRRQALAD